MVVSYFELDEMSTRQAVHRPSRIVLQLVIEPGEVRGIIGGQDVHLPFYTTDAACWVQVASGCGALLPSQSATTSRLALTASRTSPSRCGFTPSGRPHPGRRRDYLPVGA